MEKVEVTPTRSTEKRRGTPLREGPEIWRKVPKLRHGCTYSCAAVCNGVSPRSTGHNPGGAMEFLGGIEEASGEEK